MKNTIFIFLLLPFFGMAQINSSFDFIAGFDHSYRTLGSNLPDDLYESIIEFRAGETGKNNWRIGFNYNKRLNERIHLKSGFRLTSSKYDSPIYEDLTWPSDIGGSGEVNMDSSDISFVQFGYNYMFLEVPIIFRYECKPSKFTFFIESGLSPNIFLKEKREQRTNLETKTISIENRITSINTIQLVGSLSVGVNYSLQEKWQLFAQPVLRYHFTSLLDAPIVEHLYNYGIEMGVRFKIN